jgi:hypothetical protein
MPQMTRPYSNYSAFNPSVCTACYSQHIILWTYLIYFRRYQLLAYKHDVNLLADYIQKTNPVPLSPQANYTD